MQIQKENTYTLVSQENESVKDLHQALLKKIDSFNKEHLVLKIVSTISSEEIQLFLEIANAKRAQNTSFVVFCNTIDIDAVPDEIQIAPTLEEAKDILEMDVIARELGI